MQRGEKPPFSHFFKYALASMLLDPGVTSATHNSDLVGPEARFPHAYLCSAHLLISSAFHLLDLAELTLRKGT